jgi:hypothetical protein
MSTTARSTMSSQSSMTRFSDSSQTVEATEDKKLALMRYFEKIRMTCAEIAPEVLRGKNDLSKYEGLRKFARLKKIMKGRVQNTDELEEKMSLINDFDHSETIRMDGNISSNIYKHLMESRGFDIYARLRNQEIIEQQQALRVDEGVDLEDEIQVPTVFTTGKEMLKQLPTTTPAWKIDKIEPYHAPVGFASNPVQHPHSLGNENYFSYDGSWRNGKMEGTGVYVFGDGLKYEGLFKENWPEGHGKAVYHGGDALYDGQWSKGRFQGKGEMKCHGGSHYKGHFVLGRRDGHGIVNYGIGLVYEGDFRDGKPHGRGRMSSDLTGYAFEGTFVNGRVHGSGVLITPAPDYQRVVRIWEKNNNKKKKSEGAESAHNAYANNDDASYASGSVPATAAGNDEEDDEDDEDDDDDDGTPDGFSLPGVVR